MTNYVRRFIYIDDQMNKINFLIYPFLWCILFYGAGFLFVGGWSGVNSSSLFQAMTAIHPFLPAIWGACALLAGILAIALIATRKNHLGDFAALFGVAVWVFAGFMYIINGFWLVLLTVVITNLSFWVWYYMRLSWYKTQKRLGKFVDVE